MPSLPNGMPHLQDPEAIIAFHTRGVPGSQGRMEPMAERGFLVLADISGFTQFVAGSELEHGPPIIADLLEVVIDRLAPPSRSRRWRATLCSHSVSTAPSSPRRR